MKDCREFIASGILELYVLGETTAEEDAEVQEMARLCPEVGQEILEIGKVYEKLAMDNAIEPDPIIRPFLLATIDYTDRMKNGEPFSIVPPLSESSKIEDYEEWISREDMFAPEGFEGIHAKILSYSAEMLAALVWLREMAPQEVHHNQYERFLILEGTCDITIEEDVHSLKRGDYLQIPLHKSHFVTVTSSVPCKILLQRVAA
jgi:mannose-6-phosphate isomerase-like protein (cupin superfamily)